MTSGQAETIARRTQRSFGYQWTVFGQMAEEFRRDFLNYIHPLSEDFFPGKLGLDAGCGFGRHVYHAAEFGARMVGLDFSKAIVRAAEITAGLPNVRLVQGDIGAPPFRSRSFDFVYSIGVLHHLADPEAGFRALLPLVRPGGVIFIWVYSKSRRVTNAVLEAVRAVTSRLPLAVTRVLSLMGAIADWCGFILPYRLLRRLVGPAVDRYALPRIRVYAQHGFSVVYADWFDRLVAPIRHYYDGEDLAAWAGRAGLADAQISPTGLYGWRLLARVPEATRGGGS
ncbi:MAG: class I SAM-dependent methyltransferase [Candidatus Rokubacteria bacterium]|nr:class I SAM-dependent methyltransferase [Candidatus Rokubacteria bacterium]